MARRDSLLSLALLFMVVVTCWAVAWLPPVVKPTQTPIKLLRLSSLAEQWEQSERNARNAR